MRSARQPAARQRPRPDAEIVGGEVSLRTSLHITRSPRRREQRTHVASCAPLVRARAAHYHAVAEERRCASQQKLRANVAVGSFASFRARSQHDSFHERTYPAVIGWSESCHKPTFAGCGALRVRKFLSGILSLRRSIGYWRVPRPDSSARKSRGLRTGSNLLEQF
jgi:hypothetical protein